MQSFKNRSNASISTALIDYNVIDFVLMHHEIPLVPRHGITLSAVSRVTW